MKNLEIFYNNHFKTNDMMDWDELTEKDKQILKKSNMYSGFIINNALNKFISIYRLEIEKIIVRLNNILTNSKRG